MFDICGMGNPLVDFLVQIPEHELVNLGLVKGGMTLIQQEEFKTLQTKLNGAQIVQRCGDATANTMATLALLGRKVAFVGKTGTDSLGDFYLTDLNEYGITHFTSQGKSGTGTCLSFITPDAERTMATYLGACVELEAHEVPLESLTQARMLYLTGYQLEPPLREAAHVALAHAKKNNVDIVFDVADAGIVTRNKDFFHSIIQEYASLVFANEREAIALVGETGHKAAEKIAFLGCTAVVKLGEKGSIVQKGRKAYDIPAFSVMVKDTTGAGDNYAAGFLYGYLEGLPLPLCGLLGALIAAECVQQEGARLPKEQSNLLREMVRDLIARYTQKNGGGIWTTK